MRVPAADIGLCYPLTGINHFVECLGLSLSKRILIASEEFSANTLLDIGFLDHLVLPQDLDDFVNNFAHHIAGLAPLAVRAMKSILRMSAAGAVNQDVALKLSTLCLQSQDLQEGFAAKRERRSPRFTGH